MFLILLLAASASVQASSDATSDGGKAPRIPLNDGHHSMPTLGLGTFLGFDENGQKDPDAAEVNNSIKWATEAGYRLIDTASAYGTEAHIGRALAEAPVPRKDMFIVTKLAINEKRDVLQSLRNSLKRLNMDYVDLYLIHNPVSFTPDHKEFDVIDYLDTWREMERAQRLGLARSIGVSNFNSTQLQRLWDHSQIKPAVLQVEVNLNLAQEKLISFCKEKGIVVMAYTPFGSLFSSTPNPPPRYNHPTLVKMGEKYKKTVPQIALRYLVQRGVVPIPKSVDKQRIEQNINVFDFVLSPEDMDTLSKFNADYRVVWPSYWQDHPYYPFERAEVIAKSPFLKQ